MTIGTGDYEAEIRRTTHSVAHVRAGSWGDLGFGQGYACAEDHGATIVDQIVKVRGTRARYFGRGVGDANVDTDIAYRALDLHAQAAAMLDTQPAHIAELAEGYAAGVNAALGEMGTDALAWCRPAAGALPIDAEDVFAYATDLTLAAGLRNFVPFIASARPPGPDGPAPAPPLDLTVAGFASCGWAIGRDATAGGNGIVMANPHFPWYGEVRFWECHLTLPGHLDVYGVSLIGTPGVQMGFNRYVGWAHTFSAGNRFTVYRYTLVPDCPTRYVVGDEERDMVPYQVAIDITEEDGTTTAEERTLYRSHHGPILNLPLFGWGNEWAFSVRDANSGNDRFIAQFLGMGSAAGLDEFRDVFAEQNGVPWVNTMAADSTGRVWYIDASRTPNLSPTSEARFRERLQNDPITRLLGDNRVALLDGSDPDDEWVDEDGAPAPGLLPLTRLPQLERTDWVTNSNESHWLTNPASPLEGFSILCGVEGKDPTLRTVANMQALIAPGSGTEGRLTAGDVEQRVFSNRASMAVRGGEGGRGGNGTSGNGTSPPSSLRDEIIERCRTAGKVPIGGRDIDVKACADVLDEWDGTFDLDARGAILWREFVAGFDDAALFAPGALFTEPFDINAPHRGPTGLVPALSDGADPVTSAMARAVVALEDAGIAIDDPLRAVQWAVRGGDRVAVHGGQEVDGVINVLAPDGMLPSSSLEPRDPVAAAVDGRTPRTGLRAGGYAVTYGTSFTMVVELGTTGPRARGFLAYGQSGDPDSPHHRDQTRCFAEKALRPLLFDDADIAADPALTVRTVRGTTARGARAPR